MEKSTGTTGPAGGEIEDELWDRGGGIQSIDDRGEHEFHLIAAW